MAIVSLIYRKNFKYEYKVNLLFLDLIINIQLPNVYLLILSLKPNSKYFSANTMGIEIVPLFFNGLWR